MDREKLVAYLENLPVEEFVALLRDVFQKRVPFPEEAAFHKSRFFLGVAGSMKEITDENVEQWRPWDIEAAAYVNADEYPPEWGLGPTWGLCQSGTCSDCNMECCSNNKAGVCPICGGKVYMT